MGLPPYLWNAAGGTNFKFGARIDNNEYYPKNAKLGQTGTPPTSCDLLLNFGTASISPERLKLETSNLVARLTITSTIEKNAKLGQTGTQPMSRDLLLDF